MQTLILMKSSNSYLFYPDNTALSEAIAYCTNLDAESTFQRGEPQQILTRNTLSCLEQHLYDAETIENLHRKLADILSQQDKQQDPIAWAVTQTHLGLVQATIGANEANSEYLNLSIDTLKAALGELSQENTPQQWAACLHHYGTALQVLGQKAQNAKLCKASSDALTDALLECKRETEPLKWALTMFKLGVSFHAHGSLLKGNRTFQKSVVAYKNALAEFDADNSALALSATHNNRGAVLQHLGESEQNADRLKESIRAYNKAMLVAQEQQLPIHIVVLSKVNIATARAVLAEFTQDAEMAQETADEFEVIIEIFHDACQAQCLAHCEKQLAHMLSMVETFKDHPSKVSRV